ncbi:DUF348 domain-containing protein [Candidatus Saccharibacteria bacterium]|nr:DUF348 domain-containing protein [Candidatus Saccharibacteria bacterium]
MQKKFSKFRFNLTKSRKKRVVGIKKASRHPYAVPIFTFLVLLVVTAGFFVITNATHDPIVTKDSRIVIISQGGKQQIVPSRADTVGVLLAKLNISLDEGDVVEPAKSTKIDQNQFRINIYRAVPVMIVDGTTKTFTFSAATTARSIAQQSNKDLYSEDIVQTDPATDFLKTGAIGKEVVIDRSTPITVNLYGTQIATRTHADTIADYLKQNNIKLAKDDQVSPAANTPISAKTQLFITRNGIKIESVTEPIAMPQQIISDGSLAYGTSATRQAGTAGEQVTTYQNQTRNGVVVGRSVLQTVVTKQPVTEIVVRGTNIGGIKGDMALAGISPDDYTYADYIISHESGWNPGASNGSGAFGLCQALPGSKMASAGADWATNPVTQLKWCAGYAQGRYGSWAAAYNYWISHRNW